MASIGIDLGTTNSVASHFENGQARVLKNRDGVELTPSVVSYRPGAPHGEYLVGYAALNYARQAPRDTIYSAKRVMGLHFDDPRVKQLAERVPYGIGPVRDGSDIGVRIELNGEQHTPIQVSTRILEQVKIDAEKALGKPVEAASITVPAYFLDSQRNATKEAGEAAGLRLHPLLDEPIAAALGFGLDRDKTSQHRVLVFDLGGGTFDVSIIQIAGDNLQVLLKYGDMWLGGDDFDEVLVDRMREHLNERFGVDEITEPAVRRAMKHLAEQAKKKLSTESQVEILEPHLMRLPDGKPAVLDFVVTRGEFEQGIRGLVDKAMGLVDKVLDDAKVTPHLLTSVLLVGGSTYVPLVRQALTQRFGAQKLRQDVDPMHCVSLGAAVWCQRFPFDEVVRMKTLDRTGITIPMDLGVEIFYDANPHHFVPIVRRQTRYPTKKGEFSREFFPTVDNQRLIRVAVFQGDSAISTYNSYQGMIEVHLPQGIPARTPVKISFDIDLHGNLSGDLNFTGHPELKRSWSIQRNQPQPRAQDMQRLNKWRDDIENAIAAGQRFLENFKKFFSEQDRAVFVGLIAKAQDALARADRDACQSLCNAISMAMMGSGTASDLFLAQRAQEVAGDPKLASAIVTARVQLEQAYERKNEQEVKRIGDFLKITVNRVLASRQSPRSGPEEGQLTL